MTSSNTSTRLLAALPPEKMAILLDVEHAMTPDFIEGKRRTESEGELNHLG